MRCVFLHAVIILTSLWVILLRIAWFFISTGSVLEAEATINGNISGAVELILDATSNLSQSDCITDPTDVTAAPATGLDASGLLKFTDWLVSITAMLSQCNQAHRPDFFGSSSATFEGLFSTSITALSPFDEYGGTITPDATLASYDVDFFANESAIPAVTYTVELPGVSGIKNINFDNVKDILSQSVDFLIGDQASDTTASCSGGLLGMDVDSKSVFSFTLPGTAYSACYAARLLQTVVDAVKTLTERSDSLTFNRLGGVLEELLTDPVESSPNVTLNVPDFNQPTSSSLEIKIDMEWSYEEGTYYAVSFLTVCIDIILLYFTLTPPFLRNSLFHTRVLCCRLT